MHRLSLLLLLLIAGVGLRGSPLAAFQELDQEQKAAQEAIERRDFTKALDRLAKSLKVRPESADLHFLTARTARRAGAFNEAKHHLDECARLNGSAEAIALERKLLQAQVGELEGVEEPLSTLVTKRHPDTLLILEAMSQGYIELFRLEDAMKCLNLWLELKPKEIQALLWRAKVKEKTPEGRKEAGNWTYYDFDANLKGLSDYQKVVAVDPQQDEARLRIAQALLQLSRPKDAFEQFQYLLEREFRRSVVLLGLARCRVQLGELEEAESLLEQLLKDDPRNASALTERARLALQAGQTTDAEKWLRNAVMLDSFDYQSNYLLSLCLTRAGKSEEATAIHTNLKRIEEDLVRINDLYKKVVEAPRDLGPRCELGQIFLRNNREAEGLRWLRSVLRVEPGHKQAHLALAEYYSHAGKKDLAEKHRELAGKVEKEKKESK
jgi:tetratricopeptide (TPR) repeat protein